MNCCICFRCDSFEKQAYIFYQLTDSKGSIDATWTWLVMENMSVKLIGNYVAANYSQDAAIKAFYVNRNKTFQLTKVGGKLILNKNWTYVSY